MLSALTGAATGFAQLLVVRSLFGFAEGPMNSTTNRMITNWFPREETSRTIGFTFSGQTVGSAIAAPVIGLLALAYSWRIAFFATGALGLLWVVVWRYLVTDLPGENHRVSAAELDLVATSRAVSIVPAEDRSLPLRAYLMRPSTLSLGLGMFAVNYTLYIFLSWLPSYLTGALHMDVKRMSFVAAIPWACGFIGYVGGGIVADYAYRHLPDRLAVRKLTTIVPLALAAAVMLLTSSVQSCWAPIHELVPETQVGGVSGFIHFLSNISGIIGPIATGFAVQYLGGYDSAFAIASILAVAGVLAMTLFVRRPQARAELRSGFEKGRLGRAGR